MGTIREVAAHVQVAEGATEQEMLDILGNSRADREAKGAAQRHPAIDQAVLWQYEQQARDAAAATALAQQILPLWPKLGAGRGGGGESAALGDLTRTIERRTARQHPIVVTHG